MKLEISDETTTAIRVAQATAAAGDVAAAVRQYRELLDALGHDDYQSAAVAHMFALIVDDPEEKLAINEDALMRAQRVPDGRFPAPLFASLYANLGYSNIELGRVDLARAWYEQARVAAAGLDDDDYGRLVRSGIETQLGRLTELPDS